MDLKEKIFVFASKAQDEYLTARENEDMADTYEMEALGVRNNMMLELVEELDFNEEYFEYRINKKLKFPVLDKPYTAAEIITKVNENGYITGIVQISLHVIIDGDLESFLDNISDALIGNVLLMDISYTLIGTNGDNLLIKVTGDAESAITNILEDYGSYKEFSEQFHEELSKNEYSKKEAEKFFEE